ncbi:proline-rich receptor-like protein kinase PERK13 [Sparus aurata]|uniref:proline-rich receptor-like protein kinase PERK13 n=1 Tax=Sparus aurata TaxID=8175 RepID=UPI0011C145FC|nr:proline-rich receptor-like protein kinase PERK13 [Sparus aurata]
MDTEDAKDALVTIKRIYESLLNVTMAVEPPTRMTPAENSEAPPLDHDVFPSDTAADPALDSVPSPLLTSESDTEFTLELVPVSSLTPLVSLSHVPPVPSTSHSSPTSLTPPVSSFTPLVSLSHVPPVPSTSHSSPPP